jgi:hypothetical protein
MNRALGAEAIDTGRLDRSFDRWWPDLEEVLSSLPTAADAKSVRRTSDELLEEILLLVRNIDKESRTRRLPVPESFRDSSPWSDPDAFRYWLTFTMADRDQLKGLYTVLRDRLAERPVEPVREESDDVEDVGGRE